jgi:plastocyanin
MKGAVRVLPKGAKAPSRARHDKAIRRQVAATARAAKKLAAAAPAGAVVQAGSDRGEVAFFAFFPGTRHIGVGDSVSFRMSKRSTEIHNVVFGPDDFVARTATGFIAPGAQGIAYDPVSVYPSDPGALVADGSNHGNGFVSTGLLDTDARTPFPASKSIRFTKAGAYRFICTVHGPSMTGTIAFS